MISELRGRKNEQHTNSRLFTSLEVFYLLARSPRKYFRNSGKSVTATLWRATPPTTRKMVRNVVEKIKYPAFREMNLTTTDPNISVHPNMWSIEHDKLTKTKYARSTKLYTTERTYFSGPKPASATDFYNTDQSSKMSVERRVTASPYRYFGMRAEAGPRVPPGPYLGTYTSTPDEVGPGSYDQDEKRMPRHEPGTSAFASGMVRGRRIGSASTEPGYSSLSTDLALWNRHANRQSKGYSFPKVVRWERAPGPGSNRPAALDTPGPGAYRSQPSWPAKGFKGSARGFNHNM